MEEKASKISERLTDYGVRIISLVIKPSKTPAGRHVGNQLLKSGTSAGANYEEARGAERGADFIHKLKIVLKEVCEEAYWLRLIRETRALTNTIAKSIITAKSKQR